VIIIDASLALEIAIATRQGGVIRDKIHASGEPLAAPEIIELEVLQTLRRYAVSGQIGPERVVAALRVFDDLAIERFAHVPLRPRIWALRANLTSYDAAYFALAELLGAPLWTQDAKFRAIPGAAAMIEIV
jgi:predicted nucleic acid-binding protein